MATRGIGLSGLVTRGSHSEVKEPENYVCEPYIQLLFSLEMSGPKTVQDISFYLQSIHLPIPRFILILKTSNPTCTNRSIH